MNKEETNVTSTFWTYIDGKYYRIYNNQLVEAPRNKEAASVNTHEQKLVISITETAIDKVNILFNKSYTIKDFGNS